MSHRTIKATHTQRKSPPRRPTTGIPDFLVALVFAAWTMSGIFFVASFSPSVRWG